MSVAAEQEQVGQEDVELVRHEAQPVPEGDEQPPGRGVGDALPRQSAPHQDREEGQRVRVHAAALHRLPIGGRQ